MPVGLGVLLILAGLTIVIFPRVISFVIGGGMILAGIAVLASALGMSRVSIHRIDAPWRPRNDQ